MTPDSRSISAPRKKYAKADQEFIESSISQLLKNRIVEASSSPWRAEVVFAKSNNHKKRLCIDYSQTAKKFTTLDAFPLSTMQNVVNNVSR